MTLAVDQAGRVTSAAIGPHASPDHHNEVLAAALRLRFVPFERDGHAVPVSFTVDFEGQPADYSGPDDRTIPEMPDLTRVRIRLERTACLGRCPIYSVEIGGTGEVTYRGRSFVLATGEHHWRIPQEKVVELLALMRRADYLRLDGLYFVPATDLPSAASGLDVGDRHKWIVNYGASFGNALASTSTGAQSNLPPPILMEVENSIDRLSGANSWTAGDEETMNALRQSGWNFRSRASGLALLHLIADCRLDVAGEFLDAGAPLVTPRWRTESYVSAVRAVAACGDADFVRRLFDGGLLRTQHAADDFLAASVRAGFPDIVELALQHS